MKNLKLKVLMIIFMLFTTTQSFAGLIYTYNRLALNDLEQMSKLIKNKIKESRAAAGNKTIPLKEALQAVYSRPNNDFMIEKIVAPLKSELEEHEVWEKTIRALVKEATGALKNPKAFRAEAQVTYAIFLENLISEFKPKMDSSFEKSVITQIKDAKIELSKTALHERKLRVMKEGISPSKIAEEVLENYEKEQKNLQVKEKAEADKKAKQTLDVSDKVQEDTSQK